MAGWLRRQLPPLPILRGPAQGLWWCAAAARGAVLWHGYEPEILQAFADRMRPGLVVFDLGAHVGLYTLVAAKRGAIVHAFEPERTNRAFLVKHLAMNGLQATVQATAVSATTGSAPWHGDGYTGRLSRHGVLIDTVCLDDLDLPRPDLLKIDVEGAEAEVLHGGQRLLKAHRPMIILATHSGHADRACLQLLQAVGYHITRLAPDVLVAKGSDR